jgi:hypothetical protein
MKLFVGQSNSRQLLELHIHTVILAPIAALPVKQLPDAYLAFTHMNN